MNSLPQVVKFNNQDVPVFFQDEKPYVAMKPICENIGLDWNGQFQRIKRNHILSQGMCMIHTPTKGGNQEMVTLPIGYLNGWLFGIDVNKVKPEIKDTLIKYQLECYDVLYNHFMPKVAEQYPNTITIEQQQAIKGAVLAKVHREGKHYQAVYHEFYREFNIPRYQELPLSKFDQAINWLNDGFHANKPKQPEYLQLIKDLVDAVLDQNTMSTSLYQAVYTLDSQNQYLCDKVFRTNLAALKLTRAMDMRGPLNRKIISDDLKTASYTGGNQHYGSRWFHPLVDAGKLMGALNISGGF
ncbi:phage antirepressor N-terminal domain-containing protein [Acinetobacter puyangensis]|uniref:phage antirepressor N-terminal domain-containing protein n=1 Tax=Acinetobacter puyangensis TaxID=1096779 RepID=UPI003A4DA032